MTLEFVTANRDTVDHTNNCVYEALGSMEAIWPRLNNRNDNPLKTANYSADRVMLGAAKVDGDLLLTVTWGGGFGIFRIENDGSVTELYHDPYPVNNYRYMTALAVNQTRNIACVGSRSQYGLHVYDYSDLITGGSIIDLGVKNEPEIPSDRFGYAYWNGIAAAGDWVYMGSENNYDAEVLRWNVNTGAIDNLPITRKYSNGRRQYLQYYPGSDRVYIMSFYNGCIQVVTNASQDTAEAWQISTQAIGMGNDMRIGGVVETNDPNILYISDGRHRVKKVDITTCLDPVGSSTPTVLESGNSTLFSSDPLIIHMGTIYPGFVSHPDHGDMMFITPDRGRMKYLRPFDHKNYSPMGLSDRDWAMNDGDPLEFSYGGEFHHVVSADGTDYYVSTGYGRDGHQFHVYADAPQYADSSWEVEWGPMQMSGSQNIRSATILQHDSYEMGGATLTYYVSNNNGWTWETVSIGADHVFSSTGNQFRLKIVASIQSFAGAHVKAIQGIQIALTDDAQDWNGHAVRFRMAGLD